MATLKEVKISRNWGIRANDKEDYPNPNWRVEKGEPYDLVQFMINELDKNYYWCESLHLPCGLPEEEINKIVQDFVETQITEEQIIDYRKFLEDGEKWGWN